MRDQGVGVQRGLVQMRCELDSIELMNGFRFECSHRLRVVTALWDWHAVSSLFLLLDIDPGRGYRGLSVCCKHLSKAHTPASFSANSSRNTRQCTTSPVVHSDKVHAQLVRPENTTHWTTTGAQQRSTRAQAVRLQQAAHSLMKGAEHLSSAGEAQLIDTGGGAAGHSD